MISSITDDTLTHVKTVISILRWIAVLPGAALAAVLARVIVGVLITWGAPDLDDLLWQFSVGLGMGCTFAAGLVFSGAWIAPSKKNATGLVLAVLILLMVGVWVGLMVSGVLTSVNLADPKELGEIIGAPAIAIYAVVMAWRSELGRVVGSKGET